MFHVFIFFSLLFLNLLYFSDWCRLKKIDRIDEDVLQSFFSIYSILFFQSFQSFFSILFSQSIQSCFFNLINLSSQSFQSCLLNLINNHFLVCLYLVMDVSSVYIFIRRWFTLLDNQSFFCSVFYKSYLTGWTLIYYDFFATDLQIFADYLHRFFPKNNQRLF